MKILVVKLHQLKYIFAYVVFENGFDPAVYTVDRSKRDVTWLCYTTFVFKLDGERAISTLLGTF